MFCASRRFYEFIASEDELKKLAARIEEEIKNLDERRASLLERRFLEHFLLSPDSRDYKELKPFQDKGHGYIWNFWNSCRIFVEYKDQTFASAEEFLSDVDAQFRQLADLTPLHPPQSYYHPVVAVGDENCPAWLHQIQPLW